MSDNDGNVIDEVFGPVIDDAGVDVDTRKCLAILRQG